MTDPRTSFSATSGVCDRGNHDACYGCICDCHAPKSQPAPAPDDAAALAAAREVVVIAEPLLIARHNSAHNGDIVNLGPVEDCGICSPVLAKIRQALAALPAHPPAPPEARRADFSHTPDALGRDPERGASTADLGAALELAERVLAEPHRRKPSELRLARVVTALAVPDRCVFDFTPEGGSFGPCPSCGSDISHVRATPEPTEDGG